MPGIRAESHFPGAFLPSRRGLRVLVVDDDPCVRETLSLVLASVGVADVTQAAGGFEAIALLQQSRNRFDLVFCDLQMPGADGLDVIHACGSLKLSAHVVLMSGAGESALSAAGNRAREKGYYRTSIMAKPFSLANIRRFLDEFACRLEAMPNS